MINFTSTDAVIAVIGFVGVLSTAVVLVYSFKRNRTAKGNWQ